MTHFAPFSVFHGISFEVFIALFTLLPWFSNFSGCYSYFVACDVVVRCYVTRFACLRHLPRLG